MFFVFWQQFGQLTAMHPSTDVSQKGVQPPEMPDLLISLKHCRLSILLTDIFSKQTFSDIFSKTFRCDFATGFLRDNLPSAHHFQIDNSAWQMLQTFADILCQLSRFLKMLLDIPDQDLRVLGWYHLFIFSFLLRYLEKHLKIVPFYPNLRIFSTPDALSR